MDLGGLVARNARTVPDKEGIIYQDNRYTWKEVNDRVNTVSHALIAAGVKKGDKVAMWMFNSDLFMFAFYGIVKAGAVAVPVNFRLAAREAEYIFGNCDAVAVIFDDVFEPAVREMKPRLGQGQRLFQRRRRTLRGLRSPFRCHGLRQHRGAGRRGGTNSTTARSSTPRGPRASPRGRC